MWVILLVARMVPPSFVDHSPKLRVLVLIAYWVSSHDSNKDLDHFREKNEMGQKTAFLARNSAFFYATPMKPPFFGSDRPDSIGSEVPHILR